MVGGGTLPAMDASLLNPFVGEPIEVTPERRERCSCGQPATVALVWADGLRIAWCGQTGRGLAAEERPQLTVPSPESVRRAFFRAKAKARAAAAAQ